MAHQQVPEACPNCGSRRIGAHPSQAGLYQCSNEDCQSPLARLKREGIFGESHYYVNPDVTRPGITVHTEGRRRT